MNRTLKEAFRAAGCGLQHALRTQRNLRIQCGLAAGALAAGVALDVSTVELAVLILTCGVVLGLELLNTGVESLVDSLWPHRSDVARTVKDTAAAAVVVAAAAAAAVGGLVLGSALLGRLGLSAGWIRPAVGGVVLGAAAVGAGWRLRTRPAPSVEASPGQVVESRPRGR